MILIILIVVVVVVACAQRWPGTLWLEIDGWSWYRDTVNSCPS